jgi:hypothetical protein
MIRDVLDEILCVIFEPKYAIGETLDISHMQRLVQRVINGLCERGKLIVIDEEQLADLLHWLNTYCSPAALRCLIASASGAELRLARDSYLDWWRKIDAICTAFMAIGNTENSSLMPLAHALAPVGVALLLPIKSLNAKTGLPQAV